MMGGVREGGGKEEEGVRIPGEAQTKQDKTGQDMTIGRQDKTAQDKTTTRHDKIRQHQTRQDITT